MPASRLSRRVAVVGISLADCGRVDDATPYALHAQAARRALADSGLDRSVIDGFASAGLGTLAPVEVAEYLGLRPTWVDSTAVGGATWEVMAAHAADAIAAGRARAVLLVYGSTARADIKAGRRTSNLSFGARGPLQFEVPYGHSLIAKYAMAARRHMHEYGTTSEQLAEVGGDSPGERRRSIAAYGMGAREVTPEQAPELHGTIDRICALADMPKPKVAIAESDVPNAFATGRSEKTALVCATTGLLRRLEPEELEGVLAHEMSHVAHRDVAVMTIASFLGVLAGIITRIALWGGFARSRPGNDPAGILLLLIPLISAVVYAISFLLTRLLSRYRELSADRAAALLTGRPSALASALTKVSGQMARIPTEDLRKAEPYNAFYFMPAFSAKESLGRLFSSHPTLEQRLDQLSRISTDLSR
ncbi:Protease HtpX [Streptomyces microflavus]